MVEGGHEVGIGDGRAIDAERLDGMVGGDGHQLGENLPEQAGELPGVPGADAHGDARLTGQPVDDEVAIGRHVVHAGLA
ncbi:hypothetical protein [Pseudonocardia nigra]|uniref:hypothetical protein n=1 Tax=Pseudonocardia nigra TaxID=1921578 RepID=UPI001C60019F|nr:hypothetical protein [Pseudonocardia nigra]